MRIMYTYEQKRGRKRNYYLLEYMSTNESLSSTIGIELTPAAKRKHILRISKARQKLIWKYSDFSTVNITNLELSTKYLSLLSKQK